MFHKPERWLSLAESAIKCFINTKTNGYLGRRKDVACIFVLGGVGVGQIVSSCALGADRKSLSYNSSITCLLPSVHYSGYSTNCSWHPLVLFRVNIDVDIIPICCVIYLKYYVREAAVVVNQMN